LPGRSRSDIKRAAVKSLFSKPVPEQLQIQLRRWMPPVMLDAVKRRFGSVHYRGDLASWADARRASEGFDSGAVLDRVMAGALAVKNGEAAYERDSVTFREKAYVWPVLSGLLWAAARNRGELRVLDFGGSLGSLYYQHRTWLAGLPALEWSIVEQPHFVEVGKRHFEDEVLRFFPDIESAITSRRPNLLLISAVLQYLEEPYAMLERLLAHEFDVVLIDRTAFSAEDRDRLTIQSVGARIYPASYPAWFFSRTKFLAAFEHKYRLVETFPDAGRADIPSRFEGFLFGKKA
jgi:putative methyltransferase (TIGR04325 family)